MILLSSPFCWMLSTRERIASSFRTLKGWFGKGYNSYRGTMSPVAVSVPAIVHGLRILLGKEIVVEAIEHLLHQRCKAIFKG